MQTNRIGDAGCLRSVGDYYAAQHPMNSRREELIKKYALTHPQHQTRACPPNARCVRLLWAFIILAYFLHVETFSRSHSLFLLNGWDVMVEVYCTMKPAIA